MNSFESVVLTEDEIALIERVIVPYEIETNIGALLKRAAVVPGGRRIRGTYDEVDELLGAVWVEMRGFHRLDEERAGRELDEPIPGSMAAQLATIYEKIEQYLS